MLEIKDKIIIDTNLWISFLLTKNFSRLDYLFNQQTIVLLFSRELLEEFIEVAQRPKFTTYFSTEDLQILLQKISAHAQFIVVESLTDICRDPKDNFLLSLAIDGKATHLITGDKDLLDIQNIGDCKIITMTEYLQNK